MKTMRNRNMEGLLARRSEGGDRLKEEEGFDWGMLNPLESKYLGGDREFDLMYGMGKAWDAGKNWLGSFGGDDEKKAEVFDETEYKDPEEGYHSVGEEAYMNYGKKGSGSDSDFGVLAESKKRDDEGVLGNVSMHDAPEYAAEQEAWAKMAAANPDQFEKEKIAAAPVAPVGPNPMDQKALHMAQSGVMPNLDTPLGPDALDSGPRIDQSMPTAAGPAEQFEQKFGRADRHPDMPVAESLLAPEDTKKKKKKKGLSKSEKAGYAKMGELLMDSGSAPDMRPPAPPALSIKQGQIAFPGLLAQQAPAQQRYTPRGLV